MNQMTTFGGGSIPRTFSAGGQYNPLWQMGSQGAELSPMARRIGTQVLPAGTTSRQELRYLLEEAKRSGRPYTESPRTYTQGGREQDRYGRTKDPFGFYDEQGRRFYGSTLGRGGYGGHGAGNAPSGPKPAPPVTTGKFDTSNSSTPSSAARGPAIGEKEKAKMLKRVANDPRRQFGWTGPSPLASNEERDARRALDISRPMGQGRASGPVAPSPEPRPMAMPTVPIFPYLRPKSAYDLGESRGYGSFSNYPTYGPSPL